MRRSSGLKMHSERGTNEIEREPPARTQIPRLSRHHPCKTPAGETDACGDTSAFCWRSLPYRREDFFCPARQKQLQLIYYTNGHTYSQKIRVRCTRPESHT